MRRPLGSILPILATCALLPVGLLIAFGHHMVMPPMWVHFYAVGVSALVATVAAVAITAAGARRGDTRTVIVGGGFSLMAALLAVHGLTTPGMLVGSNGLIAVTGAATLPVGGVVMALSALPQFASPRSIPRVIALQVVLAVRDRRPQHRRHREAEPRAGCAGAAIRGRDRSLRDRDLRLRRAGAPRDEHLPAHAPRSRLRGGGRNRAARLFALRSAVPQLRRARLVARTHLRVRRHRGRRRITRL